MNKGYGQHKWCLWGKKSQFDAEWCILFNFSV